MGKLKTLITNPRILLLLIAVILAVVAIRPSPDVEGVAIRSVTANSSASLAGIENPSPTATPTSREVIVSIDNQPVASVADYNRIVSGIMAMQPPQDVTILTNDDVVYRLATKPLIRITVLNETEEVIVPVVRFYNETLENGTRVLMNETVNETRVRNKELREVIGTEDIGLSVYPAPTSNIRKGLDLQGGTRVLLIPERKLAPDETAGLIDNMKERLNVYGLSDIIVREAGDLSGNQYILVEIAGASRDEVRSLLAKQGKFEAKIGNKTVFSGGDDITYVARSADQAGIDPQQGCGQVAEGLWSCRFRFSIALTPEAAQRQAEATKNLEVVVENGNSYLTESIYLYLDDALVDELRIGAELRGRAETQIQISGSGQGQNRDEAVLNSLAQMKRLQTILITGSLPVKLEIVKTDTISPSLGEEFVRNAMLIGLVAILAVSLVVFVRYRKWQVSVPMLVSLLCEIVLLLGMASLIGWNIDLAAIAGIIIAVGTGVDHLIIITDDVLRQRSTEESSLKERIKRAFIIIMGAYLTVVVAMVPLWFAGAGLLKGFAVTTILGVTFGVFIVRPAFAKSVEILLRQ